MPAAAWLATAALLIGAAAPAALAQNPGGQAGAMQAESRDFDIPAQPLTSALTQFGQQSGRQVTVDGALLRGLSTPGVRGRMSPEQALRSLLRGTGLTYGVAGGTIAIQKLPPQAEGTVRLDTVQVEGTLGARRQSPYGPGVGHVATRTATGTKTDTPITEIPQSISVVTESQIREQGAQTLSEALRYTPGVLAETYGASSQFDYYTQVRGFRADQYLDGMRTPYANTGWASSVIDPYGLERVEVLKGPASGLFGQTGPGGMINMVSKRPTDTPLREVMLQTGSYSRMQGAFDLSDSFDKEGTLRFRLTGLARDADTQVDYIKDNRTFIAPALTWEPTKDTSVTLLGMHQRETGAQTGFNYLPTSGTLTGNPNGRIPVSRYSGEPTFDRLTREQYSLGYVADHRFDDVFSVRQSLRYSHNDVSMRALNRVGELQADNRTLNRAAFGIESDASALTIDNQAKADFSTGFLDHQLLFGVDYRNESNDYNVGRGLAPPIDIYNPVYGQFVADPGASNFQRLSTDQTQVGAYIQDQVRFDRWVVTLGGRHDWADTKTRNRIAGTEVKTSDDAFTGRVGVNYLFGEGAAVYGSYSTSFQPLTGTDFFGNPFRPSKGRQYEVGVKYQPKGTNSLVTVSVFDLTESNRLAADPDPSHPFASVQYGEVNVRGIELEGKAELFQGFNVIASYTYLDHEVTKSANPAEIGRRVAQTPTHQAALWADYTFADGMIGGLTIGGGVRYVGATYDVSNTTRTPSYVLADVSVAYDLGHLSAKLDGARLAVSATNLFDKYYITECTTGQGCTLGSGRKVLATLSYRW